MVAKTERAERAMTLEELELLSLGLRVPRSAFVVGEGMVAMTEDAALSARNLRTLLDGRHDDLTMPGLDIPVFREAAAQIVDMARSLRRSVDRVWPNAPMWAVLDATEAARNDAEAAASRRLGVDPLLVALAAFRRWDRTLTAERDERVAATASADASPRKLAALRGHVTRELVAELAEVLGPAKTNRQNRRKS
jgi:hypothetical protein